MSGKGGQRTQKSVVGGLIPGLRKGLKQRSVTVPPCRVALTGWRGAKCHGFAGAPRCVAPCRKTTTSPTACNTGPVGHSFGSSPTPRETLRSSLSARMAGFQLRVPCLARLERSGGSRHGDSPQAACKSAAARNSAAANTTLQTFRRGACKPLRGGAAALPPSFQNCSEVFRPSGHAVLGD